MNIDSLPMLSQTPSVSSVERAASAQVPAAPSFRHGEGMQHRSTADLRARVTLPIMRQVQDGGDVQRAEVSAAQMTAREVTLAAITQLASEHVARRAGGDTRPSTISVEEIPEGGPHGLVAGGALPRMGVSSQVVDLLERGINRLRAEPFDMWDTREKQKFIGANHVVFHEASHAIDAASTGGAASLNATELTRAQTDPAFAQHWGRERSLEEPVTELSASAQLSGFLRDTYGIDDPADIKRFQAFRSHASPSTPADYALQPRRLQQLLMPLADAHRGIDDLAVTLGESVAMTERSAWIIDNLAQRGSAQLDPGTRSQLIAAVPAAIQGSDQAMSAIMQYTGVAVD